VDFSKFVKAEDIIKEDLRVSPGYQLILLGTDAKSVVYVNFSFHQVSHSGDIPTTLMHTFASSIILTPFNFHYRDPSCRSVQGIKIPKGREEETAIYRSHLPKRNQDPKDKRSPDTSFKIQKLMQPHILRPILSRTLHSMILSRS
jgi:hypothetical protein